MYKLNYHRLLMFFFLVVSTAYSEISFNNLEEQLVLKLMKVKPKTNLVASPLMLRFPLCKLASIAKGETKHELMIVLGFHEPNMINTCYIKFKECIRTLIQTDLTYINKIYVNYTDNIEPQFITNSTEQFGLQVEKIGFKYPKAAVTHINRGVAAGTYKRITDILEAKDITKNTTMIIVNAVHFKGTWEFPFDYRLTKLMKFTHIDNKITKVPMMTKTDRVLFSSGVDCELISMKFASWKATITFILPTSTHSMPKLLEKMQAEPSYIPTLVKNMQMKLMRVFIPRFKIKTYVDWSGFLQELGLYSIFEVKNSDLRDILRNKVTNKYIALSKVKQKVFIQIDEFGATRIAQDPNDEPEKAPTFVTLPTFTVDRPFAFQVTLDVENTGHMLFSGVYYGPEPETPLEAKL